MKVEPRVVHPQRPAGVQRRKRQLLPEPGDELQPASDVVEQNALGQQRTLEDPDAANVHVRIAAVLHMEEAGIDAAEPVEMQLFRDDMTTFLPVGTMRRAAGACDANNC